MKKTDTKTDKHSDSTKAPPSAAHAGAAEPLRGVPGVPGAAGGGTPFEPDLPEVVARSGTGDAPEGQVGQRLGKGYKLRGRLLRPASVVVAKRPAACTTAKADYYETLATGRGASEEEIKQA